MAGSESSDHHPIHGEVRKAHEYEVVEIEKLVHFPMEPNHGVKKKSINQRLNCNIYCLYSHLHQKRCI